MRKRWWSRLWRKHRPVCHTPLPSIASSRPSQRTALQTLRAQWGDVLLPYSVHEDENIAQACGQATNVCAWAPQAQSSHDLQGISQWLMNHLPTAPQATARTPLVQPA